ncbi:MULTISPECIES: hypothetical protein [Mesorhizobium]|uniref:hypothetical protein n=1 Tax=Mesorhizobium TaxID=68287 RepID=UPI0003CECAD6|nr:MULTISPECIES: hypothetical protein [Mesorhizobium]ESY66312.1 hypothetical protein X742_19710 [Mesorhizobium sp. LNHC232B00]WJI38622.1 hypothetical protein NL534_33515 [Mesorhizobium opportunistum]
MDAYLLDENWNALVNRLAGPFDAKGQGWTRRDEVVAALMDAGVWPLCIKPNDGSLESD